MLKFGMPTLIETDTIEQCAALCADPGLSFIEMNMNLPQYQVQTMDLARLRKAAEKKSGVNRNIRGLVFLAILECIGILAILGWWLQ
jgi:hypothetical protein